MTIRAEGIAFIATIAFMVGVAVGLLIGEFPQRRAEAGYPGRMADTTPTFAQSEPTLLGEAVRALIVATLGLLQVFGLNLTPEQSGAILLFYVAVSAVISVIVRSKVTPGGGPPLNAAPPDRGDSFVQVLIGCACIIVIIAGIVWLSQHI